MTKRKIRIIPLALLFLFLGLNFQSCLKDDCNAVQTYIQYTPVYKKIDDIRKNITIEAPRELKNPGKLYFYGTYIFVNEIKEGVHIIDNSNPERPQNISFVGIPGSVDMAAKNGRLYVDNYIDLLTIDIENPTEPKLITRTENVFNGFQQEQDLGYLVDYVAEEKSVEITCSNPNWSKRIFYQEDVLYAAVDVANVGNIRLNSSTGFDSGAGVPSGAGTGGSMARFTIVEQLLYTVDEFDLRIFDLTNCDNPTFENTVSIGWGIETIFPHEDNLFIGANDGMYIFDNSNPTNPTFQSKFDHSRACDPVFVVGDIAYVTLRDGTECEGFDNQLDVVDVSDVGNPQLIASHPMDNPHGLSVLDNTIYICEGVHGFKSFDASDNRAIGNRLLDHVKNFQAFDVIALPNKLALVIGIDGLYQFDVSDPEEMRQISVVPVLRD